MAFDIWVFFEKSVEKIPGSFISDKNNGHFTLRHLYSETLSRSVLLKMRIFRTTVVEKIKTHILYSIVFFVENRAIF